MNIKRIKNGLDIFVYAIFVFALLSSAYNVYTKDILFIIPSVFGVFVFGSCILVSRLIDKRIKEIGENNV